MRNIFLEQSFPKCSEDTIPKKIKIEHISASIVESFMQFVFAVCKVEGYQNILKLSCRPLAFTSYKAFLENKKRFGTSLLASFSV